MRKLLALLAAFAFFSLNVMAQRTVTGKVTDETGAPVANASVTVKGTRVGTTTDANGNFSINLPADARELVVSSAEFEAQTLAIGSGNSISVKLARTSTELEGVVVTGYSRIKKSQYVGAASKIDNKAIEMVPIGSFDQILQGRAPGLRVSAGSGQPGAAASVQIRGPKSISGGSTPLYIIDGVPVEASVFQSYNPNDFESVDVIKDASAAALYGSRGASGVIVVTTKRGKKGKTTLTYRPQVGITQPGIQQFEMMTSAELLEYQEKLGPFVNNNLPGWRYSRLNPANASASAATLAQYDAILDSLRGINTNWKDIFQRQGSFQSHDLNLSGGSENTRFYASLAYYKEDGIGERSDLERYTFRFNLDHTGDRYSVQLNSTIGYSTRDFIESENGVALANPFAAAYLALPYQLLFKPDGTVNTGGGQVGPNAYQRIRDIKRYNNQLKATIALSSIYDVSEHVYLGFNTGADFRETVNTTFLRPGTFTASTQAFPGSTGSYSDGFNRYFQANMRGFVGYKTTIADDHSIDVTVNGEYIFQKTRNFAYTGYGLNTKLENTPAAITPGTVDNRLIPAVGGGRSERAYASLFATLKYSYADKYVFDFTARRDGTSILPEQNRYDNFFAAGVLWNVLKEGFTSNWNKFSTLRVRASYGSSANAENFPFGDFGYFPLYGTGSYAGFPTVAPSTPGNPAGRWEYTNKFNLGIEFGLWQERLYGEVNLYNEVTNNLFISQGIPIENGSAFTSAQVNAGEMRNRGIEVNVNFDIIRKRDGLNWSVGGNFAYNQNEILSLGQENEFPQGTAIIRTGLPLGSHYVVKWAGVDAATGRPLYYDKEGKVTSVFSSDAQVAEFGTFYAPWTGGFNTSVRYKGFEFGAFFNFQAKFSRFNNQDFFQLNHAFALQGFNLRKEMLNMWTTPGQVTDIQSATYQRQFSSKDIQDASYLRLRNVQMAYTFPGTLIDKMKVVKSVRIYVQAQNLYTWTKWTGFDPEDNNNIAQYEYPLPRTFTAGLDISF